MQNPVLERNRLLWHILKDYDQVDAPTPTFMTESRTTEESLSQLSSVNIDYVLQQIQHNQPINLKQFIRVVELPPLPRVSVPPPVPSPTTVAPNVPKRNLPPVPQAEPVRDIYPTIEISPIAVTQQQFNDGYDLPIDMDEDEILVASYEAFLLSTSMLTMLREEVCSNAFLFTCRIYIQR
jgi:hypothetical protein